MTKAFHDGDMLYISSFATGFIEIPDQISLNVYASGCFKRCANCHNSQLWMFSREKVLDGDRFSRLLEEYRLSDWVCFLGGEPLAQPNAVAALSRVAKQKGRRVCVYTGLEFEGLGGGMDLSAIDVLIDGEYREELGGVDSPGTNQRVFVNDGGVWERCGFKELAAIYNCHSGRIAQKV